MKKYALIAKYNLKEHTITVNANNKKEAVDLFIDELYKLYSYLDRVQVDTVFSRNKIYAKSYLVK